MYKVILMIYVSKIILIKNSSTTVVKICFWKTQRNIIAFQLSVDQVTCGTCRTTNRGKYKRRELWKENKLRKLKWHVGKVWIQVDPVEPLRTLYRVSICIQLIVLALQSSW